jgi:PAS domain S-box-containing protein
LQDEHGMILDVNHQACEDLGYSHEELVKLTPFDFDVDLDRSFLQQLGTRLKAGETIAFDTHYRRKDGTIFPVEVRIRAFHEGPRELAISLVRDITARKHTEERLRLSENRYRMATKATNDIIWEWNPKTNELIWSENAGEVFGYSSEEIGPNDKWWDNHIHPEDRERVLLKLSTLIDGTESIWQEEYRFLLKNGSYANISDHGYIEREVDGKPLRMTGAMSDITSRQQAEIERQVLLEIMQGLANTADLQEWLALIHHSVAKVIYAQNFFVVLYDEENGLFEEIYSIDQYDPPEPPSKLEKSITSYVFRSGQPLLLTQEIFDELVAQGEVILVGTDSASWLGVPIKTSGKTIGVMAVQYY